MKDRLRDLENIKMLTPDDPDIVEQKWTLRKTIEKLERDEGNARKARKGLPSPLG